jgi:hypothetical protein
MVIGNGGLPKVMLPLQQSGALLKSAPFETAFNKTSRLFIKAIHPDR